jgi:aminopeptidase N
MTVFNGSGGMEFPMMVNDTKNETYSSDIYLTSHEISHTYFPFYMGTNERKYAWMDEGWAVFLPQEFQTRNSEKVDSRERYVNSYLKSTGTLYDVPMMVQSHQLRSPSYRIEAYQKAACTYDILKDILGKELFTMTLQEYIKKWNGKHPTPYDFFNTFSSVTEINLDWFFRPWYFEFGYPDLGIKSAKNENGKLKIEVEKIGNYPVPVSILLITEKGSEINLYESADAWSNGKNIITIEKQVNEKIVSVTLGSKYIPDVNLENNYINLNK